MGERCTINIPAGWTNPWDLFAQGFSADLGYVPGTGLTLSFCTSNVAPFHVGN